MKSLVLVLLGSLVATAQSLPDLKRGFDSPPDDARIMMRWWWFGPSVTKAQLEREMVRMKEGGIGGFEVQPVYPLALDDPAKGFRNFPFLSDEFLDALQFTAKKAKELGLRMDLTLGSGWPFGGPQIPIEQAAGRLRVEKVAPGGALPKLRDGESVIAAFDATTHKEVAPGSSVERRVFIASHTRQMVKRAAAGAEGYVLNHYDDKAIDNYLRNVGDRLMKAFPQERPHAIFCDSLESFGSDWVPDMLEQFQRRRGYDLKPYLPALVTDIGPNTAGIRHDWGRTLTELLHDRFLQPMRDWSTKNRVPFRIQDYGIPPAVLSSNAYPDTSEGEGAQWRVVRASRWASSASHLYGRPVTTSETWTWLHSPVFRATPLDVKAEADLHFIQGINQLIGHGWPYTAEGVEYPGWRFYASGVFNDKNPWWIVMPDMARYLQRLSYLLRQGRPVNDVALYLPNSDAWSRFTAGRNHMIEVQREMVGTEIIPQILDSGYGFDFFDDGTFDKVLGKYRVIVLPGVKTMPPETAKKLDQFIKAGGTVLATRRLPDSAPGFSATEEQHVAVRAVAPKLRLVSQDAHLAAALKAVFTPDLAITPSTGEVGFIHRSIGQAEVYFIANNSNAAQKLNAIFRVSGLSPELWDPHTGRMAPLAVTSRTKETVILSLDMEPYGSRTIVFSKHNAAPAPRQKTAQSLDISKGWTIRFGDAAPQPLDNLASWTDDQRTRFYSGIATYERNFDLPAGMASAHIDFGEGTALAKPAVEPRSGPGIRAWFDGPIREAAVVYVNGRRAGSVWCPPYRLDVTPHLKPGANQLRVVVANLAINYMAGHPLPDYTALYAKYGRRFDPQDMDQVKPIPSGLFGPIKLLLSPNKEQTN